jgi:hypothetical protein
VNPSARVKTVTGVGTLGQVSLRGADVRRDLGLRSTWFRVGTLALPLPARPVAFGAPAKLTGTARGLANVLLEQLSGSTWKAAAAVKPVAGGAFTVTVRPTATTSYRLVSGTARTAATPVRVAPNVALAPVTDAMELRGTVKPLLTGAGVEIQKLSGRTWETIGRATVDARGDFAARIYVPPGSYRALVPAPGRGLVAGTSSTLVVNG